MKTILYLHRTHSQYTLGTKKYYIQWWRYLGAVPKYPSEIQNLYFGEKETGYSTADMKLFFVCALFSKHHFFYSVLQKSYSEHPVIANSNLCQQLYFLVCQMKINWYRLLFIDKMKKSKRSTKYDRYRNK